MNLAKHTAQTLMCVVIVSDGFLVMKSVVIHFPGNITLTFIKIGVIFVVCDGFRTGLGYNRTEGCWPWQRSDLSESTSINVDVNLSPLANVK